MPPIPQVVLVFALVATFTYFLFAGARTFVTTVSDDLGAGIAQLSFLVTGAIAVGIQGLRISVHPLNGITSACVLCSALGLYEWARHVILGRRFSIAWSGRVPESLCERGPYRYVRHPIYESYILAFLAALLALPSWLMLACFLFNAALFLHAAISDENTLKNSPLARDYARYSVGTGMFFPSIFP